MGSFLAELGADVLKIENRQSGGDVTRSWKSPEEHPDAPLSAYYASVNWNKRVRFANLAEPEDRAILQSDLQHCDILLCSFRPGSRQDAEFSAERMWAINPRMICAKISGFGPSLDRPAYDLILQAESGWMSMNGEAGGRALKIPIAIVDILAAHQLKEGILLALLQRERTGKGSLVEVSLYDAAISGLANQASNYLMSGSAPARMGSLHPNIAPYGEQFPCADGKMLVLAIGSDEQFRRFARLVGHEEWASDPDFSHNPERVLNRGKLAELIAAALLREELEFWLTGAMQEQIPVAAIRSLDQVFEDQAARDMVLSDQNAAELTRHSAEGDSALHSSGNSSEKMAENEKIPPFFPQRVRQAAFFLRSEKTRDLRKGT